MRDCFYIYAKSLSVLGFVLGSLLLISTSPALLAKSTASPVLIDGHLESIKAMHSLSYFIDETEADDQALSIENIIHQPFAWTPYPADSDSLGYHLKTHWFRLEVNYQGAADAIWWAQVDYSLLDNISYYLVSDNKVIVEGHAGDRRRFHDRPVNHRNFVFPLSVSKPGSYQIYFRVQSEGTIQLPLTIWSDKAFKDVEQVRLVVLGIFFGALAIMFLYNIFIAISVREVSYYFYIGYILSFIFLHASVYGVGFQYLWPENPEWNNKSLLFFLGVTLFFGLQFVRRFLDLKCKSPLTYKLTNSLIAASVLCTAALFFLPYFILVRLMVLLCMVSIVFGLYSGVKMSINRYRPAFFFTVAWAAFLVGALLYLSASLGLIGNRVLVEFAPQIGAVIEVLLLSLAFADKINQEKKAKFVAQNALLEVEKETYQAVAENKAKSEFLAKMSHEIRTPMNGVLGLTELMKETQLTSTQSHYVTSIHNSSTALLKIINDILDFSKAEAGGLELEKIAFNIKDLVNECLSIFIVNNKKDNLKIVAHIGRETPAWVYGDPTRLRQILLNLLSNAVKFTEEGSVSLEVTVVNKTNSHDKLVFAIKDTGIGLSESQQAKLFTPFQQADTSTTRKYGGTGLGLAICKDLVNLMLGDIGLESKAGEGSTFWFSIPLEIAKEPEDSKTNARKGEQFQGRVLVADDNPVNRMVIEGMLKGFSVEFDSYENGKDLLEAMESTDKEYQMLFLDCEMPELDGFQAAKRIREKEDQRHTEHLPIVALTAHIIGDFEKDAKAAGMDDYLAKPISKESLRAKLKKFLDQT